MEELEMDELRIRIEDASDLVAAREAADVNGIVLRELTAPPSGELRQQLEPVTAVLVGTGVVVGVKMVMDWWTRRKGGLVIDLRPGKDEISRDKDLPYGFVVTFAPDGGKVAVDVKDAPDSAEKWVKEVISGAYKTVSDVANSAAAVVGANRVRVA